MQIDPIDLAQRLIRRPSVTPADAGAMDIVEAELSGLGFNCRRMRFGEIENLYARRGTEGPNLCFGGHTDVVPAGDTAAWAGDPFAGALEDGWLKGRGAADMKGAVAAWIAAVSAVDANGGPVGSLSLIITGDEEGPGIDGTKRVVETLIDEGERIDHCLVGEPTCASVLGDQIKIGRRGSLNAWITVEGRQGHVAYPDKAVNPAPILIALLTRLQAHRLDDGFEGFQASNLEITDIEIGNPATNGIPARAKARLNIRFNPAHTGTSLTRWLQTECAAAESNGARIGLEIHVPGEAFLTPHGGFSDLVTAVVAAVTGVTPALSTTGGASDARFLRELCPVLEFGLVGATMHQVDEQVRVEDVRTLTAVYQQIIEDYFASPPAR